MKSPQRLRREAYGRRGQIYSRDKGKCRICGQTVARLKKHKNNLISKTDFEITYIYKGIQFTHAIATIDHVLDVELGGDSKPDNLILCCAKCNHEKNERKLKAIHKFCDETGLNRKDHWPNIVGHLRKGY